MPPRILRLGTLRPFDLRSPTGCRPWRHEIPALWAGDVSVPRADLTSAFVIAPVAGRVDLSNEEPKINPSWADPDGYVQSARIVGQTFVKEVSPMELLQTPSHDVISRRAGYGRPGEVRVAAAAGPGGRVRARAWRRARARTESLT